MKKFLILTACISTLFAEDPAAVPLSEQQAKQEIETFMSSPAVEQAAPQVQLASPALPEASTDAEMVPTKPVELITESPDMTDPTLSPEGVPNLNATPAIVEEQLSDPEGDIAAIEKEEKEVAAALKSDGVIIDLGQVFSGSPTIYTVLFCLSVASVAIWAYALINLRTAQLIPAVPLQEVREKLQSKQYDEALALCGKSPSILFNMISAGIQSRSQGKSTMLDLMKSEGRRASNKMWQRIALLNDIAVIAPMLGLLGTVLGMFYAFYDLNRSMESISALFDGLGISVGTTVGGLIVAILALVFHSITKYRLTRQLTVIENEAHSLASLINTQG
jgi:biopolymer transport protein ExbB